MGSKLLRRHYCDYFQVLGIRDWHDSWHYRRAFPLSLSAESCAPRVSLDNSQLNYAESRKAALSLTFNLLHYYARAASQGAEREADNAHRYKFKIHLM